MKRIISFILASLLFISSGCVTNPTTGEKELSDSYIRKVSLAVELASFNGSYLYLADKPEDKVVFESVSNSLGVLIQNDLTLNGFLMVVKSLPIKELKDEKTVIILDNAIILFNIFQDDLIKLEKLKQAEKLKPIAESLKKGIDRALEKTHNK